MYEALVLLNSTRLSPKNAELRDIFVMQRETHAIQHLPSVRIQMPLEMWNDPPNFALDGLLIKARGRHVHAREIEPVEYKPYYRVVNTSGLRGTACE
jgi:hypothetical protein